MAAPSLFSDGERNQRLQHNRTEGWGEDFVLCIGQKGTGASRLDYAHEFRSTTSAYIFAGCHTADDEAVTIGDRADRWALPDSGDTHTVTRARGCNWLTLGPQASVEGWRGSDGLRGSGPRANWYWAERDLAQGGIFCFSFFSIFHFLFYFQFKRLKPIQIPIFNHRFPYIKYHPNVNIIPIICIYFIYPSSYYSILGLMNFPFSFSILHSHLWFGVKSCFW
jgi:hypothetical protein